MTHLAVDKTVKLPVNGTIQRIRMCATRPGLSPILIVQAGPGFPLLHEVAKFQRRLRLEDDFLVCYWDQRGCGSAPAVDAKGVSLQQQVDDLRAVLHWLHAETRQKVIVFGISLGATITLLAAAHETDRTKAVIVISADADTAHSDASVGVFLHERITRAANRRLAGKLERLDKPPYLTAGTLQRRAALMADLGGVERGRKFSSLLTETLLGMVGTYGPFGAVRAVRNMSAIQDAMLPELASLDLFVDPPRLAVPVHYIFGEQDPLVPAALAHQLAGAIATPSHSVTIAPNAAHMVHFDQPEIVRAVVMTAR